jgi:hypothetical protein
VEREFGAAVGIGDLRRRVLAARAHEARAQDLVPLHELRKAAFERIRVERTAQAHGDRSAPARARPGLEQAPQMFLGAARAGIRRRSCGLSRGAWPARRERCRRPAACGRAARELGHRLRRTARALLDQIDVARGERVGPIGAERPRIVLEEAAELAGGLVHDERQIEARHARIHELPRAARRASRGARIASCMCEK